MMTQDQRADCSVVPMFSRVINEAVTSPRNVISEHVGEGKKDFTITGLKYETWVQFAQIRTFELLQSLHYCASLASGKAYELRSITSVLFHLPSLNNKVEGPEYEELVRLHDSVYDQAVAWFTSLKDNMKAQILNHFGSMPGKEPEPQVINPYVFILILSIYSFYTKVFSDRDFCCIFICSKLLFTQFCSLSIKYEKQLLYVNVS